MMEHPGNNNRKPLQFLEFKEPGEGKVLVKTREVLICERGVSALDRGCDCDWSLTEPQQGREEGGEWG